MPNTLCIFEDVHFKNLHPLVYFRPVYDLRCGILTLKEKIQFVYPQAEVVLHTRKYLENVLRLNNPGIDVNILADGTEGCLFINGSVIADNDLSDLIPLEGDNRIYMNGDKIIAVRLNKAGLDGFSIGEPFGIENFKEVEVEQVKTDFITYPWDLVSRNADQITADFKKLVDDSQEMLNGTIYDGVNLVSKGNIYIAKGAKIKPGVVIDAEEGPVYIGENVILFPNVVIEGPCFIGDGSKIKTGAKIYEGTSIGPVCKVGGEVEESIIHSYSNKQHDGFLGHAYLASWVNLGADTNNSDLKNNYGNVKVTINDEVIDSGSMFVGLTMGDHSKSGINTMFNTGTVVGVSSNVFGSGFPDKYIPSFSWGGCESVTTYRLDKCLEVAKRVMARRKIDLSPEEETVFKHVFNITSSERTKRDMPE